MVVGCSFGDSKNLDKRYFYLLIKIGAVRHLSLSSKIYISV